MLCVFFSGVGGDFFCFYWIINCAWLLQVELKMENRNLSLSITRDTKMALY